MPLADVVTEADVQHVSWKLVRTGRAKFTERTLPIDQIVATQAVIDKERMARNEAAYRDHGQLGSLPMALDGDLVDGGKGKVFLLSGHHHVAGAVAAGATELRIQVMSEG